MKSARGILSPTKQNQEPTIRGSPSKLEKGNLNQILLYLKQNGIKLPPHLLGTKNPQQFSLKLNPVCDNKNKTVSEIKSLKIKLNDTQFQLKKIEQDFAQYKRTVKIQKDKQQRKFQQAFQRLKQDSKQNNEDYDFAKQKQQKIHSQQTQKLRLQYITKLQKLQKQMTIKHSNQLNKQKHKSASQLQNLQLQHNHKYQNLHKQLTQQIETLKKEFEKQKHNINMRNKQKLEETCKKYQSTCTALQSEKKTEQKLHQKSKIDAQRQKQKLFGQLCYEKNVRKNLEDEVVIKTKEIKELKVNVNELKIEIQILKENNIQQKKWIQKEHQKQVQQLHQEYENKIRELLQKQTQECEIYEQRVQKLQFLHQQSQKMSDKKLLQLSLKFDQRLSKPQDLDQIKKLTDSIVKRDQQIKKLSRELRYRNLQIQNKQQVYNKIFKSSHRVRQQKKLASINKCQYPTGQIGQKLERDSWSKQSLFRKSQTADIKFILKNMNQCKTKREEKGQVVCNE